MEKNLQIMTGLVKNTEGFFEVIQSLISQIQKIPSELPYKRIKKNMFSKIRGPAEIPDIELTFTDKWEKMLVLIFSEPPGTNGFRASLKEKLIKGIKIIYKEYKKAFKTIKSEYRESQEALRISEENKNAAQNQYKTLCSKLEDQYKKVQATIQSSKGSDAVQKAQSAFSELKEQFIESQKQYIDMHNLYNTQLFVFSSSMERVLTSFEEADNKLDLCFQSLFMDMDGVMDLYIKDKRNSAEQMRKITEDMGLHEDFDKYYEQNDLKPIHQNDSITLPFTPPALSFNVTEYIDPSKLFEEELERAGALVVHSYTASGKAEIDVEAGSLVSVLKTKSKMSKICIENDRQKIGYVPSEILLEAPELKRRLCRLTEIHQASVAEELDSMKGEVVLVLRNELGVAYCLNALHVYGALPSSKLVDI